jgi:transposase
VALRQISCQVFAHRHLCAGSGRHRQFDAGKLIKGKKRHVLVDRLGLLLHALVTPADVQDHDGGLMVLSTLFGQFPFLKKLFADAAYTGPVFHDGLALAMPGLITEIVRRCDRAKRFVVLPKRWIVERTAEVTEKSARHALQRQRG